MSQALRITHGGFGRVALLDMNRSLVRHAHPHCHVLLKISGDDTQFLVGDTVAPLTATTAVLVNAWETHAYLHDPARRNTVILALYIEPHWLDAFRPGWMASGSPGFFERPSGAVGGPVRRFAHDLAAALAQVPDPSPEQAELLPKLMIAVLEQFTRGRDPSPYGRSRTGSADRRVRRAIGIMRADPAHCPGVGTVASLAGISRAHFFRLFERSTGLTPHVFLNALKVERAVTVVAAGEQSLAEIGSGLGFGSPAHFSRFFRDHVSVAPGAFRTAVRSNAGAVRL